MHSSINSFKITYTKKSKNHQEQNYDNNKRYEPFKLTSVNEISHFVLLSTDNNSISMYPIVCLLHCTVYHAWIIFWNDLILNSI